MFKDDVVQYFCHIFFFEDDKKAILMNNYEDFRPLLHMAIIESACNRHGYKFTPSFAFFASDGFTEDDKKFISNLPSVRSVPEYLYKFALVKDVDISSINDEAKNNRHIKLLVGYICCNVDKTKGA